jgi:hypothetical protein
MNLHVYQAFKCVIFDTSMIEKEQLEWNICIT